MTIEHILPDADQADNGNIGNLIPLEAKLNERCNGKDYKEKLNIYSESNFKTARLFSERYQQQDFHIEKRANALGEKLFREILRFNSI